jgi:hypothetical protein
VRSYTSPRPDHAWDMVAETDVITVESASGFAPDDVEINPLSRPTNGRQRRNRNVRNVGRAQRLGPGLCVYCAGFT